MSPFVKDLISTLETKKHLLFDDEPSSTQNSISSPSVSESVKNRYCSTPLSDSNSFGTVHFEAHINTVIDKSINHVLDFVTTQGLNTLHQICELERTQLLTMLAKTVQNLQLVGDFVLGLSNDFLYVIVSTASLKIRPQFFHICINLIYILIINRKLSKHCNLQFSQNKKNFQIETLLSCDNHPKKVNALDPDSYERYLLPPKPETRATLTLF